jgi:hypothetical protein
VYYLWGQDAEGSASPPLWQWLQVPVSGAKARAYAAAGWKGEL